MLPDFLLIGAMKCGTSTLQAQLARQPGVFMTTPKEPNFFSDDDVHARGLDWYKALFAAAAPGDLKGEASTHYTKLPTHPQALPRMRAVLPAPRLIYMIRNPVERAISHYIHAWSVGAAGHDPEQAFAAMPELVDYGRYAMQIAPYLSAYGADRVFLTSLEQITADPASEFARIAAFLGLPEGAAWVPDLAPQNVSGERYQPLPFHGLLVDSAPARILRRALVPKALRARIRKARTLQDRPHIPTGQRAALEATFLADRAALAEAFAGHPALDLCYPFAPR